MASDGRRMTTVEFEKVLKGEIQKHEAKPKASSH